MGADTSHGVPSILKTYWPVLLGGLGVIAFLIIPMLGLDVSREILAMYLAVIIVALIIVWKARPGRRWIKLSASIAVIALALAVGYLIIEFSQPRFEIRALNTLEGDVNTYELTDQLIWNADSLDRYGVAITFTLEIVPDYAGSRKHGEVVALISGAGGSLAPRTLWSDFDSASRTRQVHLTLRELLDASGLQTNTDPPSNPFRPGDPRYQEAYLEVRIAPKAESSNPWTTAQIKLRNEAWEFRANRVWRNAEQQVDVYVKNLGGKGDFSVHYYLIRLEETIGLETNPMISGISYVARGFVPRELETLETGGFFTKTISLPGGLEPGRYLVEVYPIKKQEYVRLEDGVEWEKLNMPSPWWFGGGAKSFVYLATYEVDDEIKAEWERLAGEGIDLGGAIEAAESVTSKIGTRGRRQVFQNGEIYIQDDQAYALYGPILEHYRELGGIEHSFLGFPVSQTQIVTSSLGTTSTMMMFEGPTAGQAVIYASAKGVAAKWQWIGNVYSQDLGGHLGWLGFPQTDEQYFTDSTIQMYERGYIVYYFPEVNEERDWGRKPVAFPYLASRGTLVDVHAYRDLDAEPLWQDTGIDVQPGDRITIVQVGGQWKYAADRGYFDANGDPEWIAPDFVHPSSTIGTLIGNIGGKGGPVFPIGRWGVYTSTAEGNLHLIMNDNDDHPDHYRDNEGFITVQILVEGAD